MNFDRGRELTARNIREPAQFHNPLQFHSIKTKPSPVPATTPPPTTRTRATQQLLFRVPASARRPAPRQPPVTPTPPASRAARGQQQLLFRVPASARRQASANTPTPTPPAQTLPPPPHPALGGSPLTIGNDGSPFQAVSRTTRDRPHTAGPTQGTTASPFRPAPPAARHAAPQTIQGTAMPAFKPAYVATDHPTASTTDRTPMHAQNRHNPMDAPLRPDERGEASRLGENATREMDEMTNRNKGLSAHQLAHAQNRLF